MDAQHFFTRRQLSERWNVSLVTVDRMRASGRLPWIDLSGGTGKKPLVRFERADVLALDARAKRGGDKSLLRGELWGRVGQRRNVDKVSRDPARRVRTLAP